ncbi:FAD-binding oxidoreductase [Homoserinimonas sp. A520]
MISFQPLRDVVVGPVLTPEDPGFTEEVSGSNLAIAHSPDVVVGVTSVRDVSEAVRFAAAMGLPVRVQATGHGAHHAITDGMLLTTRRLDEVTVDAGSRIASIGAGATWRTVQAIVTPLGLTAIPGSSVTVGAVGYTLGGGLGPLSRSHGITSDYVRGFEVVMATGETVVANDTENAELFWALRGGKGGLGVVTRMQLELVQLEAIYAGSLFFAEEHIEAALRGWIEWTSVAADDVTTSVAILNFPDFEQVPPPLRGRRVLSLRFAYPGDPDDGELLAAPLRALAPTMIDAIAPLSTAALGQIHNDPEEPGPGWSSGMLLNAIDGGFATQLLARVGPGTTSPLLGVELRHLGAATAADVAGGSAAGGRASAFTFTMIGVPNPALFDQVIPAFANELTDSIRPWVSEETAINFAADTSTPEAFAAAWPREIHARLQAARALYDPARLFTFGPSSA